MADFNLQKSAIIDFTLNQNGRSQLGCPGLYVSSTNTEFQTQAVGNTDNPQRKHFMIFLSFRFYMKPVLGILEVQNLPF